MLLKNNKNVAVYKRGICINYVYWACITTNVLKLDLQLLWQSVDKIRN